jgi:hypothetical protein
LCVETQGKHFTLLITPRGFRIAQSRFKPLIDISYKPNTYQI